MSSCVRNSVACEQIGVRRACLLPMSAARFHSVQLRWVIPRVRGSLSKYRISSTEKQGETSFPKESSTPEAEPSDDGGGPWFSLSAADNMVKGKSLSLHHETRRRW